MNANATAGFPSIPAGVAARHGAHGLRLRRFGSRVEHLAVDLEAAPEPELITRLLAACTERRDAAPVEPRLLRELTVGKRIECLLVLSELEGERVLRVELRCPACDEPIEVELTVEELRAAAAGAPQREFTVEVAGTRHRLHMPTGADQLAWREQTFPDERSALKAMARSLFVEEPPELTEEALRAIDAALDSVDPLVRCLVSARCPHCHAVAEHEPDLAAVALEVLRRAQRELLEVVHRLASRYHWNEREIARLPPWRRARYVARLGREES